VGVFWTNEDPDYEHEGYAVAVDAAGEEWPNPRGNTWSSLLNLDNGTAPDGMVGLRAACDCHVEKRGWTSDVTVPLIVDEAGRVDVEASEDVALVAHHDHVRQIAGTAMVRDLRLQGLRGVMEIARAEGVRAVDRLRVLVEVERDAGNRRVDLVKAARAEGAEWSEIGAALGTSKQAAQQRYGSPAVTR
jgi:hypothetical protein